MEFLKVFLNNLIFYSIERKERIATEERSFVAVDKFAELERPILTLSLPKRAGVNSRPGGLTPVLPLQRVNAKIAPYFVPIKF